MSGVEGVNPERDAVVFDALLAGLEVEPPVSDEALDALRAYVSATYELPLPDDYVAFLRTANGADGTLENGAPLVLWMAEVLPEGNTYEGEQILPGCLLIGSDAGDGHYGIDLRRDTSATQRYVDLYDAPEWEMVLWRGGSLRELLLEIGKPKADEESGFVRSAFRRLRRRDA
jgi:hypothetical protein